MKVLSIKEPWASLIKEKKKSIETRSWKTNYRGTLYIHASSKTLSQKDWHTVKLLELLASKQMQYGHIIAKCQLVDCVYMDEAFLDQIKQDPQEYLCGEYQIGRYAWILTDIEALDNPIAAKGHLNIWNYQISE